MSGYAMEPAKPTKISFQALPPSDRWSPTLVVPAPVCRFEGFLGAERADALLEYAISRQDDFRAGTVRDPLTGEVSRKGRDSLVLPVASEVFSAHLADCLPLVQEVLGQRAVLDRSVTVLTAHGEGGHYGIHTDASRVRDVGTALSAVYYLHRRPRGFGGGRLRLYDTAVDGEGRARPAETYRTVEPEHDTIVFFPSCAFHEVVPSTCPSGRFEDHRFTLTTWISDREPAPGAAAPREAAGSGPWQWMARAAEGTRPLGEHGGDPDGARPVPLPPPGPAARRLASGPRTARHDD
ncbi:2OG-Fe(II) oxygenase [Streptomyces sp. WAC05292]|uniref:2OG-Fe(II) oxygenase n=1 Tax=Streptomyces sp. WAC05292 TaxID=2487418 RepID=UPI000F74793C|nr:2OG-Fe(II) oxygenase [Streptomyces sp. WAC05292]RSS81353.1 2OG-Fe(II) oxygenase [Streptomyces sp. WAC05292]